MRLSWMAWMGLAALLLGACGTSEPVIDCTTAADCEGDPGEGCEWACVAGECQADCPEGCESAADCTGEPGEGCEWTCVAGECQADCPEGCTSAADCQDLPWEVYCLGHWECNDGECEEVCDEPECSEVGDCLDLVPPEGCSGHWECSMGECNWFCDSVACTDAGDCEDLPWELRCVGHWECTDGQCEAVCDENICERVQDCQDLVLPCDSGHWLCENGLCLPWCEDVCESVTDCMHLPWRVDCVGHWSCQDGECREVCDEACGDGECDAAGGESATSCPIDCLEQCRVAEDCANLPWPLDCDGHWECRGGACEAVCNGLVDCVDPIDCADQVWDVRCYGHWACEHGQCEEVCDEERCGDGICDRDYGETLDACPLDCAAGCVEAADCEELPWPIYCEGHWECQNGACEAVCDGGSDCLYDWECLDREWLVDCWGHWECQQGACSEVCEGESCGDGECSQAGGESADTCPDDCEAQCAAAVDCLGNEWLVLCQGHWDCLGGTCQAICEFETCGDGRCNPEGGEDEGSCNMDCARQCQVPADCLGLPWWVDCLGHWDCRDGQCQEACDFELCGDGECDRDLGESAQSCPQDCAVCVPEGMPTPVPNECCEGLTGLNDCTPEGPCNGNLFFCLECGNGACEPHESAFNCLSDCPSGCEAGLEVSYECADGQEVPWCTCQAPECQPTCLYQDSDSEGWYDSCSGRLIAYADCIGADGEAHQAVCLYAGSWSEGWYDDSTEGLIAWDFCSPAWDCLVDPKVNCL